MAKIRHMTQTGINTIDRFLGINESPTGENGLKQGEAADMNNYRVTLDGKLELRPGTKRMALSGRADTAEDESAGHVQAMWSGYLDGEEILVVILDGWAYQAEAEGNEAFTLSPIGQVGDGETTIFGFQNKLYFLAGTGYLCWDGETFGAVEGYTPLVATAVSPSGGGTELEGLNALTEYARVQFSPDGASYIFAMPDPGTNYITSVTYAGDEIPYTGTDAVSGWMYDSALNALVFQSSWRFLPRGINTLEVQYVAGITKEKRYGETIKAFDEIGIIAPTDDSGVYQHDIAFSFWVFCSDDLDAEAFAGMQKMDLTYTGINAAGKVVENTITTTELQCYYDKSAETVHVKMHFDSDIHLDSSADNYGITFCNVIYYMGYRANRNIVEKMKYAVLFNGATDSRVFLYGDGSSTCIYSGLDENGVARADYFPALNQANIGADNSPLTSMVRHYNSLLAFKPDETYRITYEAQSLTDGSVIAGFHIRPIHSEIGSLGMNQAVLVYNNPRTLCHGSIYEWRLSYYTSSSNRDERNAKRVSDRVKDTLSGMNLSGCLTFDDEEQYEYWVTDGETSIINNYANDTWYRYTGLAPTCFAKWKDQLYIGTANDGILRVSTDYRDDCGGEISAEWHGSLFDAKRDYLNKWTIDQYVGLLNLEGNRVVVSLETDRGTGSPEHTVTAEGGAATPTIHHVKSRAKGWAFLRTVFKNVPGYPSTIVSLDSSYRLGTGGRRL